MRKVPFLSCCLLVLLVLFAQPAFGQHGAYTAPADLDHIVHQAHTIFRGHVVSARMEHHPQFSNLETVVVTMTVDRLLKGEASGTITFRQYVWDVQDVSSFVGYRRTQELLLFLNPVSSYGLTSPVGLEQGRFRVIRDPKGGALAVNGQGNIGLFHQVAEKAGARGVVLSREVAAMLAAPPGKASLSVLEEAVIALVKSQ